MIKKTLKLSLLTFSLLGASVFAEDLIFTAANLDGNFTRENLEHFINIQINNPADCNVAIDFVGSTKTMHGSIEDSTLNAFNETIDTKSFLKTLDEISELMDLGQFKELKNNTDSPISNCAYDVVFTLSE